eukprot:CAMPEP_0119073564 /NCGR_PEP_ID=MMETSP1178-20130426/66725_1 /TAXON_ID=33656 /ORGANISM="unid sp, Strain CCMP2000" /LENGTH=153 /DNA_ID=CAMNT_0007055655 /DNA_START=76 /DNA_END=537 /DNA_ORIENTATION=-
MQDGLAAFGATSASGHAPLLQAWELKPRQAPKRKQDFDSGDLSPPSEDDASPYSTTASSLLASTASHSAQETKTPTMATNVLPSTMLSPFLNSMSMDVTPGSRMTDRMGRHGMSSTTAAPAVCNFQRRQGKSAAWAPLAPVVPRNNRNNMMSD